MCGIVGLINLDGRPADSRIISHMAQLQRHRGPDDQGLRLFSLKNRISIEQVPGLPVVSPERFEGAIAFNRLSILDLSRNAHQPMCSKDEKVFVAFNGEIYNAFDYVSELVQSGFHFRSKSDTEVLLNLYLHFGLEGMLQRINGMFAFCIIDLRSGDIHIVRDRMGIKPLYWSLQGGIFMFSSEIKSFLGHPDFAARMDPNGVDECLIFRYCAGEKTLLKDVFQLKPGHHLRLTMQGCSIHPYWSIPDNPRHTSVSFQETVDQLERILEDSVHRQLIGDVQVGCQLSGGIDSSLINIMAGRRLGAQMDMVSMILDDPRLSEERWVQCAASRAGGVSHRFLLTTDYAINQMEKVTWHLDEPINVPAALGIYFLTSMARNFMTVLLIGEGADELFGGYERYCVAKARTKWLPWIPVLKRMPGKIHRFARDFGDPGITDSADWFISSTMAMSPEFLFQVRPEGRIEPAFTHRRKIFDQGCGDYTANCLKYEMQTWLVSILNQQDKLAMAHSVENRVPFLDESLVEFSRSLPSSYHVRSAWGKGTTRSRRTKLLLKTLARRYFEPDFVYRRKIGFVLPVREYFRAPAFQVLMEESILPGMKTRGLLNDRVVRHWWQQAMDDASMEGPFWTCLALEMWAQQFIDYPRHLTAHDDTSRSTVPEFSSDG